jgi:hypothetical protein
MGLLLIGHPVFQMGKRTSQEAPLCGKTSENHSHLGLVSSILPHGSVRWGLVLEKLHGWCSSPCGHSLNSLLREAHARSLEIHCGFAWVLNSSVHLTASPLFERYQTPRRPFFFPSSWISSLTILEFSHQKLLIAGLMRITLNYPEQFLLSFETLWYLPVF